MSYRNTLSLLLPALVIMTACAKGEEGTDTTAAAAATADSAATAVTREYNDGELIALLAAADSGEIEMSAMAEAKLTDAAVKAYAKQLATDHRTMKEEGQALGAKIGATPSMPRNDEDVVEDHHEAMTSLNGKAAGKEFDEAYLEHQISMHKKVLDEINDALSRTQNADMKAFLEKAKTAVQGHLTKAEELEKKFGAV